MSSSNTFDASLSDGRNVISLQAQDCPAPDSPIWTIRSGLPMQASTGRTRLNAASSPSAMTYAQEPTKSQAIFAVVLSRIATPSTDRTPFPLSSEVIRQWRAS